MQKTNKQINKEIGLVLREEIININIFQDDLVVEISTQGL